MAAGQRSLRGNAGCVPWRCSCAGVWCFSSTGLPPRSRRTRRFGSTGTARICPVSARSIRRYLRSIASIVIRTLRVSRRGGLARRESRLAEYSDCRARSARSLVGQYRRRRAKPALVPGLDVEGTSTAEWHVARQRDGPVQRGLERHRRRARSDLLQPRRVSSQDRRVVLRRLSLHGRRQRPRGQGSPAPRGRPFGNALNGHKHVRSACWQSVTPM
jgi:hypothetical protein